MRPAAIHQTGAKPASPAKLVRDPCETKKLLPLIEPGLMALDADCRSKADAIKQAVQLLHQAGRTERPHELEHSLMQREAVSSTGFGHGFAIPHCKSSAVRADSLVILKLRNPVEWNSMDHQPVHLVILMVIREGGPPETHLQILAQLARKVMDETFRERMAGEPDPAALAAFLKARLNF